MLIDLNKLLAVNFILCSKRSCRPSCCTALPIVFTDGAESTAADGADRITENVDEDMLLLLPMKPPMPSKLKPLSDDQKQPMPCTAQ